MKKDFLFPLFVALLSINSVDAQISSPTIHPDLVITIAPNGTKRPAKPRTIVVDDINAYYSNEMLTLIFNNDLGDADIVVTNLTTGDVWNDSVSGVCSTTILLSGDEGYYQISIFTENEEYFGEFNI